MSQRLATLIFSRKFSTTHNIFANSSIYKKAVSNGQLYLSFCKDEPLFAYFVTMSTMGSIIGTVSAMSTSVKYTYKRTGSYTKAIQNSFNDSVFMGCVNGTFYAIFAPVIIVGYALSFMINGNRKIEN